MMRCSARGLRENLKMSKSAVGRELLHASCYSRRATVNVLHIEFAHSESRHDQIERIRCCRKLEPVAGHRIHSL